MRKIYLTVVGFSLICRMNAAAQTRLATTKPRPDFTANSSAPGDTTRYVPRKLHIDEINFVSSYYNQDADHSAITGGIGIQKVNDLSNGIELKLVWPGRGSRTNSLVAGLGIDQHTSASSAFVTPTGLGKQDGTRIYPSLDWTHENTAKGTSFGLGSYYSGEYNYKSIGADAHFSVKTANKNGEFSAKLQAYFDRVTMIYPSEFVASLLPPDPGQVYITTASGNVVLSSNGGNTQRPGLPTKPRHTFSAAFSYTQVINTRLQISFLADVVAQDGYLGLPFHRVYFSSGKDTIEKLPSSRFKLPLGFRANYFIGDNVILRSYYRYYTDSWGSNSNTASIEVAFKISPFLSLSPFYRYYDQTAARYFAPYKAHSAADQYYTSNYEYARFQSNFYGLGFRVAPPNGVFGWQHLHELEIRYGHYTQTTDLVSDVISVSIGFK